MCFKKQICPSFMQEIKKMLERKLSEYKVVKYNLYKSTPYCQEISSSLKSQGNRLKIKINRLGYSENGPGSYLDPKIKKTTKIVILSHALHRINTLTQKKMPIFKLHKKNNS